MTLQTIKDEVCLEMTGCPACDLIPMVWNPKLIDEIAARYARECVKASLEKAAEGFTRVTHDKITDESNIVLL